MLAGRNQRFQEQIAIFLTTRTIAQPRGTARHNIKTARRITARELTIIQAQNSNHLERNTAHGQHRTKGHLTGHKVVARIRRTKAFVECISDLYQAKGFVERRLFCLQCNIRNGLANAFPAVVVVLRRCEAIVS